MNSETIQTLANSLSLTMAPLLCSDTASTEELAELETVLSGELQATLTHARVLVPQLRRTRPYTMPYFLARTRVIIGNLLFFYGDRFADGLAFHRPDIYDALIDAYTVEGLMSAIKADDLRTHYATLLTLRQQVATMQTLN